MQVCVEVIANISILVQKRSRLIVNHELFTHSRTFCSQIVSTSQVGNRDTLAAVFSPNPIAVGQVYADSTTRIEVASKHGSTDDLRTHALARLLLETLINWRVLFEPPSIVAQSFGSQCCFVVDDVHIALPACLQSKRVSIDFGEAISEIHFALRLVHPKDGIFVEGLQVSCPIELHQLVYDSLLLVVLGISTSLAQYLANAVDCFAIKASTLPDILVERAILFAFQTTVQTQHRRPVRIDLALHVCIERFRFSLTDAFCIVVARRSEQQVLAISLIDALRHYIRVEDEVQYCLLSVVRCP